MERAEWLLLINVKCKLLAMAGGFSGATIVYATPRDQYSKHYRFRPRTGLIPASPPLDKLSTVQTSKGGLSHQVQKNCAKKNSHQEHTDSNGSQCFEILTRVIVGHKLFSPRESTSSCRSRVADIRKSHDCSAPPTMMPLNEASHIPFEHVIVRQEVACPQQGAAAD